MSLPHMRGTRGRVTDTRSPPASRGQSGHLMSVWLALLTMQKVPATPAVRRLALQHRLKHKVGEVNTLPAEHRKPLLDLRHPRAMTKGPGKTKRGWPCSHGRTAWPGGVETGAQPPWSVMIVEGSSGSSVVRHARHAHGRWRMALPVDTACPGIQGRLQGQDPIALIYLLDATGDARRRRWRGREPGPWCAHGLCLVAEAHNPIPRQQGVGGEQYCSASRFCRGCRAWVGMP